MQRKAFPFRVLYPISIVLLMGGSQLWSQSINEKFKRLPNDIQFQPSREELDFGPQENEPVPVGFSVTAFDTKTGEAPKVLVGVESLDEELLADFSVTLSLAPELADRFVGAAPYFLTSPEAPWSLEVTVSGDTVTLTVHGLENPEYTGIHSLGPRGEIAELVFDPVDPGIYGVQIVEGLVTDPSGAAANVTLSFQDDQLEVGEPRIKTDALPIGLAGKSYSHRLAFAHLELPLDLEIVAGSLPPGYELHHHDLLGHPDQENQAGNYSFTLQATDVTGVVVQTTLSLTVQEAGPELIGALLTADKDGNGSVSAGDTLRLIFDEAVVPGPQAVSSLSLSKPGDSMGRGAVLALHPEYDGWVELTLGADASLSIVSAWSAENVAISVMPLTGAFMDAEGSAAFSSEPVTIQLANTLDIQETIWVVGEPVGPLPFTPFSKIPTGISVDGLPEGVVVVDEAISGSPTVEAIGDFGDDLYTVVARHGLDIVARAWVEVFLEDPRAAFGPVRDEDSGLPLVTEAAHFGAIVELTMVGADKDGPMPEVTLDGQKLSLAPGSTHERLLAVMPSKGNSGSYTLEVSQEGKFSQDVKLALEALALPKGAKEPFIDHTWYYQDAAERAYLHVVGLGLGVGSQYELDETPLPVVLEDDSYALLEVPNTFDYFDFSLGFTLTVKRDDGQSGAFTREPSPEIIEYLDDYFNGNFIGDPKGPPKVLYQENKQGGGGLADWKEKVKAFCKELCAIIDQTDKGASDKKKKRIKNFLKAIAAHESKLFKARVQCGGGPGVTYGQIEPNTLRTILCNAARLKLVKDMIVKCTGKKAKEVCEILDGFKKEKGNNWNGPYGKKLKKILSSGGKVGDKLAALLMRLYFKTKANQSFDHDDYDNPKPPTGTEPTEKWVECPRDPMGWDIRTCGNETGKWFYAEQWRKYYHGGTNRRPCLKWSAPDRNGRRTCTQYKSNAQWQSCREKLRKRFVENFCEYLRRIG